MTKMIRTDIRIPADLHETLRRIAFEKRISLNKIFNEALIMWMKQQEKKGE